jgi:hypothetical protein
MISNGAGSDITMGYVNGACPQGCLSNYGAAQTTYPPDTGSPSKDAQTQSTKVAVTVANGVMSMEFDRLLSTTTVDPAVAQTVLWAYNPSASAVTSDTVFQKHLSNTRGQVTVLFNAIGVQVSKNFRVAR